MRAYRYLQLALLVALCPAALAQQQTGVGGNRPMQRIASRVPGQAILRTAHGVDVQALVADAGGLVLEGLGQSTWLVHLPPGGTGASDVANHPGTSWFEPNFYLSSPETGECGVGDGVGGQGGCTIAFYDGFPSPESYYEQPTTSIIDVAAAQDLSLGIPSVVAVIDTGVDPLHPVLASRVLSTGYDYIDGDGAPWDVPNGLDDDSDGLIDEALGHGTHVAGIIALINPDALILPMRVLDTDGNGTAFDVARAMHAALDQGVDVINLSLGMNGNSRAVREAIQRADDLEVTVVASAGNTAGRVLFPARANDVVGVAALEEDDTKASFSSFGDAVEVSAPGVEIYSAMPGDAWAWWSGTSMAAAVVSGGVSLLHSVHGNPALADGAEALEETSVDIDDINHSFEELLGDGRIDVTAAALWILNGGE